jgi:hypothetical protein
VGRFEQGGEFGRFLLALFTKIELANPLDFSWFRDD